MNYQVAEIEDARLDAAVAKAKGYALYYARVPPNPDPVLRTETGPPLAYSSDWRYGGPLIQSELISLMHVVTKRGAEWSANFEFSFELGEQYDRHTGPTPLIAAMRAFVYLTFGGEVELP